MSFTVRPITPEEYAAAQAVWDACFPEDAAGYSDYYLHAARSLRMCLPLFGGWAHGGRSARLALSALLRHTGETLRDDCRRGNPAGTAAQRHRRCIDPHGACAPCTGGRVRGLAKTGCRFYAQFGYRPFAWHERFRVEAGELAAPEPALHTPSAEEMLACYDALAAGYNGMMVRTVRDMELMRKETAVLGGEAFAAGGAYALCLAEEGGAELTELAGRNAMPLVCALAARFGAVRFRLPYGALPEGLPKGERMMFSMLCPLNREALLAGSGAESMEELLSGAKSQTARWNFVETM